MKLGLDKILVLFGIVINSVFIVFGSILLFTSLFSYIPNEMKKIVGIILLAYGLIRIKSLVTKINTNNNEAE